MDTIRLITRIAPALVALLSGSAHAQLVHLSGTTDHVVGRLFEYDSPYGSTYEGTATFDLYYDLKKIMPEGHADSYLLSDSHIDMFLSVPGWGSATFALPVTSLNYYSGIGWFFGSQSDESWSAEFSDNFGFNALDPVAPVEPAWATFPQLELGASFNMKIERGLPPVPDPTTYGFGAIGLLALAVFWRRRAASV